MPVWASVAGATFLAIVWITALVFAVWTVWNRKVQVVALAQPEFLIMVAAGCAVFASSLIPFSMERANVGGSSGICMASQWTIFLGWTIVFSAVYAKTWRINHVVRASQVFRRTVITKWDVLKPFALLLMVNMAILTAWTIADPLVYVRVDAPGKDEWNRVIETYGQCESEGSALPYIIPLAVLNIGLLFVVNYQAFKARNLKSEYHESRYIFVAMASLLQMVIVGAPVLLLVRDNPLAWYLTAAAMIFFISHGILCLIFLPKIHAMRQKSFDRTTPSWSSSSQPFGHISSHVSLKPSLVVKEGDSVGQAGRISSMGSQSEQGSVAPVGSSTTSKKSIRFSLPQQTSSEGSEHDTSNDIDIEEQSDLDKDT